MARKYIILMIGIMLIAMLSLFIFLGESTATSMLAGPMILIMVLMIAFYLLAMLMIMRPKKKYHVRLMTCNNCGKILPQDTIICPSCGYENKMKDLHKKHMISNSRKNPKERVKI
jgi:hypothetical protein